MVELGLDTTNQDFAPDNDTVYVDEGQFNSSSSSFAMLSYIVQPHIFMFKSSLNKQKTVFAFCAPCKSYVSESECFYLFFFFLVC